MRKLSDEEENEILWFIKREYGTDGMIREEILRDFAACDALEFANRLEKIREALSDTEEPSLELDWAVHDGKTHLTLFTPGSAPFDANEHQKRILDLFGGPFEKA